MDCNRPRMNAFTPPLLRHVLIWIGTTVLICVAGCTSTSPPTPARTIEGGFVPEARVSDSVRPLLNAQLDAARAAWRLQETESNAIWVGRRMAYLGWYVEAIRWYESSLERWPDSFRIRRHLGHRLITVRRFDDAIAVLTRAQELAADTPNRIEADGAPNAFDTPRSSTHGNIDYHLALAHYLRGDYLTAARLWERCVTTWALTDDSRIAALHWLHLSLHRAGDAARSQSVLSYCPDDPDVIENTSYYRLVQLYRGEATADALLGEVESSSGAAGAYGLARWYIRQGETERGMDLLRALRATSGSRASFGIIAAELDLPIRLEDGWQPID